MKTKRFTSWRFFHPDTDERNGSCSGLGISGLGGIDTVSEQESVRQAILLLLSTSPGERVMRPKYGCDLNRLVFSTNNDTTAGLAIHYVKQAIHRWEPRITVINVDANSQGEDDNKLYIELNYRVRLTNQNDNLIYGFDLQGGMN